MIEKYGNINSLMSQNRYILVLLFIKEVDINDATVKGTVIHDTDIYNGIN